MSKRGYRKKLLAAFLSLLVIAVLCLLLIRLPVVQNELSQLLTKRLSQQLGTKVSVRRAYVRFFDRITLDDLLIEDQEQDTLFFAQNAIINIGIFSLFQKEVSLDHIKVKGLISRVKTYSDASANYDFLINSEDTIDQPKEDQWNISLDQIAIEDAVISYLKDELLTLKWTGEETMIDVRKMDIDSNRIWLKSINLKRHQVASVMDEPTSLQIEKVPSEIVLESLLPELNWEIKVDHFNGTQNRIDLSQLHADAGNQEKHKELFKLENVVFQFSDLSLYPEQWGVHVESLAMNDAGKLHVQQVTGKLKITPRAVNFETFLIKTDRSQLIIPERLEFISKNEIEFEINGAVGQSTLSLVEIASYYPELQEYVNTNVISEIDLNGKVQGSMNQLHLKDASISVGTVMTIEGDMRFDSIATTASLPLFKSDGVRIRTIPGRWKAAFPGYNFPKEVLALPNITVDFAGSLSSRKADIRRLSAISDQQNRLEISGVIHQPTTIDLADADLRIDTAYFNQDFLQKVLPEQSSENLQALSFIAYSGDIKGNMTHLYSTGSLTTNFAHIDHQLEFYFDEQLGMENYEGLMQINQLDLSVIDSTISIEPFNASLELSGSGMTMEDAIGTVAVQVPKLKSDSVEVENITATVVYEPGKINSQFSIKDSSAHGQGKMTFSWDDRERNLIGSLNFRELDFRTLGIDVPVDKISFESNWNGQWDSAGTTNIIFDFPIVVAQLDTAEFTMLKTSGIVNSAGIKLERASLENDFLFAEMSSNLTYDQIVPVLIRDFKNKVLGFVANPELDEPFETGRDSLQISMTLNSLPDLPAIEGLMIPKSEELSGRFFYALHRDSVLLDAKGRMIEFDDLGIDSFYVQWANGSGRNTVLINGNNIQYAGGRIPFIELNLDHPDSTIYFDFHILGDSSYSHLVADGTIQLVGDSIAYIYPGQQWLIEEENWQIQTGEAISLSTTNLELNNIHLFSGDRYLKLDGSIPLSAKHDPILLQVDLFRFPFEYFSKAIAGSLIDLTGNMRGRLEVSGTYQSPEMSADMFIGKIESPEYVFGDLTIKAEKKTVSDLIRATGNLANNSGDIDFQLDVSTALDSIGMNLQMDQFSMDAINTWTAEFLVVDTGQLSGNLEISGPINLPLITGRLGMTDAQFKVVDNNSTYKVAEAFLHIEKDKVRLEGWTLQDERGKTARIDGSLTHNDYRDIQSNLNVALEEFQLLHTQSTHDPNLYGDLYVSGKGSITGPITQPIVVMEAATAEGTQLFVSYAEERLLANQEDLVLFMNPREFYAQDTIRIGKDNGMPFVLNLNLTLDDNASFTFFIDEASGDNLFCTGAGNLAVKYDPQNELSVIGEYVLKKGGYAYSYDQFINKKFDLNTGSKITFNGDPMNALLDVTAVYKLQTSAYGLIKNEANLSTADLNVSRRRIPVEVHMFIRGNLLEPDITFDIVVPESPYAASVGEILTEKIVRLKQNPTDLNNQVFALLISNNFMVSGGTSSSSGSTLSRFGKGQTLSSLSSFFTNNLNNLAGKYVPGFEIDFNIDSYQIGAQDDYAASVVTQVELGISKQLLNDRLKITAEGAIDVDGSGSAESETTVLGNFVLEYTLTPSGNYLLRVYRKEYHDTLVGERSSKNGVGIVIKKSFDDRSN